MRRKSERHGSLWLLRTEKTVLDQGAKRQPRLSAISTSVAGRWSFFQMDQTTSSYQAVLRYIGKCAPSDAKIESPIKNGSERRRF